MLVIIVELLVGVGVVWLLLRCHRCTGIGVDRKYAHVTNGSKFRHRAPYTRTSDLIETQCNDCLLSAPFPVVMVMTRETFNGAAKSLYERIALLRGKGKLDNNDKFNTAMPLMDWQVVHTTETSVLSLVHPPVTTSLDQNKDNPTTLDSVFLEDEHVAVDHDAALPSEHSTMEWHFSVVFSDTWHVPILYFAVQHRDGSPCTRSVVLDALHREDESYEFISYDEHPLSGIPSLYLHPCRTSERLNMILMGTSTSWTTTPPYHILLSWLSIVLPAVGFCIPPFLFPSMTEKRSINNTAMVPVQTE